jgi:hypothetical protein
MVRRSIFAGQLYPLFSRRCYISIFYIVSSFLLVVLQFEAQRSSGKCEMLSTHFCNEVVHLLWILALLTSATASVTRLMIFSGTGSQSWTLGASQRTQPSFTVSARGSECMS